MKKKLTFENIKKDIEMNADKAGFFLVSKVQEHCPFDTGRLKQSIDFTRKIEGNKVIIIVGTNVEYAEDLEYGSDRIRVGTVQNPIPSRAPNTWRPFLRPALFLNENEAIKIIAGGKR